MSIRRPQPGDAIKVRTRPGARTYEYLVVDGEPAVADAVCAKMTSKKYPGNFRSGVQCILFDWIVATGQDNERGPTDG